jgi:hypothetical protein
MAKELTTVNVMNLLEECYDKCLNGVPKVSRSVKDMTNDYLKKNKTKEQACKNMCKMQIIKCTTSGTITNFGGLITLPVAIPANIGSVLYVQMRMIASAALMGGYELESDQTQTLVFACLAGVTVNSFVKKAGVSAGQKLANNMIAKIPGKSLQAINKKVGYRFITKFGETGTINLGKLVPGVGAVVGGSLDAIETKIIADRAYKWFIKGDFNK